MASFAESGRQANIQTLLALQPRGDGRFLSQHADLNRQDRIYGGQLLAQAGLAAAHHVEQRGPTYLHGLFLRGAVPDHPVEYRVELLQQGKRFSSFRVLGVQLDRPVIDVHTSFQADEEGISHSGRLVESLPPPEACLSFRMLGEKYARELAERKYQLLEKTTLDARFVDPDDFLFKTAERGSLAFWVRPRLPVGEGLPQALATIYLSDYLISLCAMVIHRPMVGARDALHVASLNHSIWLNDTRRGDEWLLFVTDSPSARAGRGLARGRLYGQDGRLVATAMQETSVIGRLPD